MITVQPPLEFIQPAFNPVVWNLTRSILPIWLRFHDGITKIDVHNASTLIELYRQFQAGKIRFTIAFRHPAITDPPCIAQLLWNQLPQIAQQQNKPLKFPVHGHFIYDRGIPLWAGKPAGWLFSKLGGTPIRRGAFDRAGLKSIRNLFLNGDFPLVAAPEGATNGHNEIVSPIEPGLAQFGFWCLEDLQKAGRSEQVLILPLGIQYRFIKPPWQLLVKLLGQLEQESGLHDSSDETLNLKNGVPPTQAQEKLLYQRLYRLSEYLLSLMEKFYRKFYQQPIPPDSAKDLTANAQLAHRLQALLDTGLRVAEQALSVQSKGNLSDRCRRIEQAAWSRIYRDDLTDINALSPAERGLANLIAAEADLRLWHMRLVENFVSVTGYYVAETRSIERFADTILLLWKMLTRLQGKSLTQPPYLGLRRAELTIGQPIAIANYQETYKTNRRQAIANLTQDLQTLLEGMVQIERNI